MKRDVARAARLYRAFREKTPQRAKRVSMNLPRALMVMGHVDFIGYTTSHADGKATPYKHDFAKGSRPLLCTGVGTNQLFLVGGRYRVTGRGIVDLDARRRELK